MEDRGRLLDRGTNDNVVTLPRGNIRVVAGNDRVACTTSKIGGKNLGVQLLNFLDVRHGSDLARATHDAVNVICRVGKEGRKHEVEVSHCLRQRPQHGRQTLALFRCLEFEGLGIGNVLIGLANQTHRSGKSSLLAVVTDQVPDLVKACGNSIQQCAVDLLEFARRGDLAELLVDHRRSAVHQVAPTGDKLTVRAAHEFRPGEVRI